MPRQYASRRGIVNETGTRQYASRNGIVNETVAAAGGTGISGDLAVTLDDATLSSTGTLALKAALSITLADATLSAAGINPDAATPDTSFLPIVRRRRR